MLNVAPAGSRRLHVVSHAAKRDPVFKVAGSNSVDALWQVTASGPAALRFYAEALPGLGWTPTQVDCFLHGSYTLVATKNIRGVWVLGTVSFTHQGESGDQINVELTSPAAMTGKGFPPKKRAIARAECPSR